jgi:hypothetical protein
MITTSETGKAVSSEYLEEIVPTLCVGMHTVTLGVTLGR